MSDYEKENIAETILREMREPVVMKQSEHFEKPLAFLPDQYGGWNVKSLDEYAPPKRGANVDFIEAASFVDYILRFRTEDTQIFAHPVKNIIEAVIDYLPANSTASARCEHVARLVLKNSDRFVKWQCLAKGGWMSQFDFAEFLDENYRDVVVPDGLTLKEIALELRATINNTFASAKNLANGAGERVWRTEISINGGKADFEIPENITLNVPLYPGAARLPLSMRLRIRVKEGEAKFRLLPDDWDEVLLAGWNDICNGIEAALSLTVYRCV